MKPQLTGHHVEVTEALKEFTEKKLERLKAHASSITHIHIVFSVDKLNHTAEGQIAVPGQTLQASATDENMYNAVDALVDKLSRQLTKYKEKHSSHGE